MDKYFDSAEFHSILERYEESLRTNQRGYFDAGDYMDLSDYYLDNGKAHQALAAVNHGLEVFPDDEQMQSVKAGVLIFLRRFEEALSIAEQLDEEKTFDAKYLKAQLAYAMHDNIKEADALFTEWLTYVEEDWRYGDFAGIPLEDEEDEINEEDAERQIRDAYLHIVTSYIELASSDIPIQWVTKWVTAYLERFKEFGTYEPDLMLADLIREQGLPQLTEQIYTKLLDNDPYIANGWTVLADAQYQNGNIDEALNNIEFALAIDENDADAKVVKANCFNAIHRFSEAIPLYQAYAEARGTDAADIYLAGCYIHTNQMDKAAETIERAYKFYSTEKRLSEADRINALRDIAEEFCLCNYPERAVEILQDILERHPNDVQTLVIKGGAYLTMASQEEGETESVNYNKSQECFAKAIETSDFNHEVMFKIGAFFLANQYIEAAKAMFKAILNDKREKQFFVNDHYLHAYLAFTQMQTEELEEAMLNLEKACKETPDIVRTIFADAIPTDVPDSDLMYYILKNFFNHDQSE